MIFGLYKRHCWSSTQITTSELTQSWQLHPGTFPFFDKAALKLGSSHTVREKNL